MNIMQYTFPLLLNWNSTCLSAFNISISFIFLKTIMLYNPIIQNIEMKKAKVFLTVSIYNFKLNTTSCFALIKTIAVITCENNVPINIPATIAIIPITSVSIKNIKATLFCSAPSNIYVANSLWRLLIIYLFT